MLKVNSQNIITGTNGIIFIKYCVRNTPSFNYQYLVHTVTLKFCSFPLYAFSIVDHDFPSFFIFIYHTFIMFIKLCFAFIMGNFYSIRAIIPDWYLRTSLQQPLSCKKRFFAVLTATTIRKVFFDQVPGSLVYRIGPLSAGTMGPIYEALIQELLQKSLFWYLWNVF